LFLDGELTGSENLGFLTHLKECDDCAGWWSDEQTISEALLLADLPSDQSHAVITDDLEASASRSSAFSLWQRQALIAAAASILTFVCTIPFWTPSKDAVAPVEVSDSSAGLSVAMANGPLRIRLDGEDWRELHEGEILQAGCRIESPSETLAVLDVGGRGSLLLEPGTSIDVFDVDLELGRVTVELHQGKVKLESGELRICGMVGDVGFSLWNSTVIAAAEVSDADVFVVQRGNLAVKKADGSQVVLHAGDALGQDGNVHSAGGQIAGLLARLSRESRRANDLSARLQESIDANGTLQSELALLQTQLIEDRVRRDALELPLSVDEIVSAYLTSVSRMNNVSVVRPDGFALGVADELRDRGLEGVLALQSAFRSTLDVKEQMAVCIALGCLGGQGAIDLLRDISLQSSDSIRRAAVLALERQDDSTLGEHFLAVHRIEGSSALGIRCLQAAAQHGAPQGVLGLLALVRDQDSPYRARGHASAALEVLSSSHPEVHTFFRAYVARWDGDQSSWVLYHALRALRASEDIECVPSLRALLNRGLPVHVRRYVTATLDALGATQF
jgi:hypothetical protein